MSSLLVWCMATRPLPGFNSWLYDFQSVEDRTLPCLWWPALMSETRRPSLLQKYIRLTLGFWYWRWALVLVHHQPEPELDINDPDLGIHEWVRWSVNWSKNRLSPRDLHALMKQKDQPWPRLLRLGAANYHYGRLVLAREAISQSRSRKQSSNTSTPDHGKKGKDRSGVEMGLEMPDLSLPDPNGPQGDPRE